MQSASNMSPFYFRPQLNQVEDFGQKGPTVWVDWCLGTPWVLYFFNGKSYSDEPLNFLQYLLTCRPGFPGWGFPAVTADGPVMRLPGCYSWCRADCSTQPCCPPRGTDSGLPLCTGTQPPCTGLPPCAGTQPCCLPQGTDCTLPSCTGTQLCCLPWGTDCVLPPCYWLWTSSGWWADWACQLVLECSGLSTFGIRTFDGCLALQLLSCLSATAELFASNYWNAES